MMGRTDIGLVCLCLWTVVVVVRGQGYDNVAPGKTYDQSTKHSNAFHSDSAANQDTSGTLTTDNCIYTLANDPNPWWEVDLGRTYPVHNISIWARTDDKRLLYPSTITVDGETCATVTTFPDDTREKEVTCSAVMYGQTVRITRNETLFMCEMEVWVPSEVSQCPAGRHGTLCNLSCSDHCEKGPGKNFCYQNSGYCYDGCVAGWYGDQCSTACSPGCQNKQCDRQTGQCDPCNTGYKGNTCAECKNRFYKTNTDTCKKCSSKCQPQSCASQTGRCDGCVDGYYGAKCYKNCSTPNCQRCHRDTGECEECTLNSHLQLPSCTGCVDGYYGGMCGMTCPIPNCQRCHQDTGQCQECTLNSHLLPLNCTECETGYYKANTSTCNRCSSNCQTHSCDSRTGRCNGCMDGNYGDMCDITCPTSNCQQCHQDTGQCQECTLNSHLLPPSCTECQKGYYKINTKMCERCSSNCQSQSCQIRTGRCNDDRNRVVLEQVGDDDASDYINASYIKGYKTDKAYIAAQGPRSNTQDDFWRMVWQEGVTDIVMLTNLKEGNKLKCHEYWPGKGKSLDTEHMEVTRLEEEERAHFVIRTFSVRQLQGNDKRQVRQYHYVKWMDHEVPATTPLVNFWRYVRARAPRTDTAPPLLVHCSAGVGRTGTYIALDILIDQIQEQEEISLYQTVNNLRNYRCHMVQNKSQYEFLHEAMLEAYMSGDSRLDSSSFDLIFPNTIQHHHPHPRIDQEFERLWQMRTCLTRPSHTIASLEENQRKNRNPDALPDDKQLVYITEHAKGRNQYINAVYMPTFLSSRGSIVTQLPLADTVTDLWRLVDSWDVSTIVSIGQEDGAKGTCQYWPKAKEQPIKTDPYTIRLKSMTSLQENLDSYLVDMKKAEDTSQEIRVLHYKAWTGEVADNVSDLIHLLDILHTSQKESTQQPIIIQCIDGVTKSGAVCALWDAISRLAYDGDVDVYLAVRHVHTVRPEAITSVIQYRFLYEVVQAYRASHLVYANT